MSFRSGRYVLALAAISGTLAYGDISIDVFPSSAPNAFGSPSWNGYLSNALNSLENGLGNIGDRTTDPTAYKVAGAQIVPGDAIVTSFNSWRGTAFPSSPFNAELGNRVHFGLHVVGDGTMQFRLNDLTFDMTSSDNVLDFSGNFVGANYSSTRIGIDWGADNAKGGGDDTVYTSGNGTTLVDEIVYVGVGNAYWPIAPTYPQNQDGIDEIVDYIGSVQTLTFGTTYEMLSQDGNNVLASGGAEVTIVPAPGAAVLALIGVPLFGLMRRRRA